ncbi:RNA polymerase sigma24 factor [Rhizocola hellebori]|uniref:RNA polymerase sigma24 factor n=1 Tax=Rhizocola hellebori TaxID=1392758 RepID=A0A8J3Q6W8_9ACTN|nr:SigE family RNA polymerase sigma factor [Rhizocola hellebori]GIH05084.1 RNA polymerase sigma24 factor [Rhizocola hellebori]
MRADDERDYIQYVQSRIIALRRTAFRLCGDWHHAHDLVQSALILLYRHWRQAAAAESLDPYVRKILVNVYLEEQRRWWARKVRPRPEISAPPEPGVAAAHEGLDLRAALNRLSAGQRAVIVLRYWEGLDVNETASALGCSPGTVKSQTSYAIAALRRLLPNYVSERLEVK